jgi:protein DGCR14
MYVVSRMHLFCIVTYKHRSDRPRSPTINSFSYVPNLPSPTPSELGPVAVKQLMTWGTLNATPRVIAQDDGPIPMPSTPFHLPAPSSREVIGQKLSNSASRSLRAKAGMFGLNPGRSSGIGTGMTPGGRKGMGNMAPPTWTPRRAEAVGSLTPAARRLLDRTTGTAAAKRAQAMEQAAGWGNRGREAGGEQDLSRVKWTPTPGPAARRGRG